jgi:quinoprotein glucose dehydrogenase
LRGAASDLLSTFDPDRALAMMEQALRSGTVPEQQSAYRTLGRMAHPKADAILVAGMKAMESQKLDGALQLDVLSGCRQRIKNAQVKDLSELLSRYESACDPTGDPMTSKLPAQFGGDRDAGRKLFREKTEVSCRRCHAVGDEGATDRSVLAGPNLKGVASRLDRLAILRSIVLPSADLAANYEEVMVETSEHDVYRGRVVKENEAELHLDTLDAGQVERVVVKKSLITYRQTEKSSMPEDLVEKLSLDELRDLVEYLSSLTDS